MYICLMEFEIFFNTDYPDKRKDIRSVKNKTFGIFFCSFATLFAIGFFIVFFMFQNFRWEQKLLGGILLAVGLIGLLLTPFFVLFKKVNKGLDGDVHMVFTKLANDEWNCMAFVNTTPEPVYNDEISLAEFTSRVVVVTLKNGKEVVVPLRLMSDDDKAKLKTVADETKQLRIESTAKKNK